MTVLILWFGLGLVGKVVRLKDGLTDGLETVYSGKRREGER
jgi:hypothetical protein